MLPTLKEPCPWCLTLPAAKRHGSLLCLEIADGRHGEFGEDAVSRHRLPSAKSRRSGVFDQSLYSALIEG